MARPTIIILSAALAILATGPAAGQDPGSQLTIEVEAGHVQGSVRGELATVVYQGDGSTNVRVRGRRRVYEAGRPVTQTFDVLAEVAVAFLDAPRDGLVVAGRLPVRGLYAQGFVRVGISTPQRGQVVFEAEELYLDFTSERAYMRGVELRVGADTAQGGGGGILAGAFVVRAEQLHARGADVVEARNGQITVCDHGEPHFAVGGDLITADAQRPPPPPIPSASPATGGITGALTSQVGRRGRLLSGIWQSNLARRRKTNRGGSDAISRMGSEPRLVLVEGASLFALGLEVPVSPFFGWGTHWPTPIFLAGSSNRFGPFARIGARVDLRRIESPDWGSVDLNAEAYVDYFEKRGTGGGGGMEWRHRDRSGEDRGLGFLRADGLRDRADEDRVGTPIRNEGRFWLRGMMRERIAPTVDGTGVAPRFNAWIDSEFSRISDEGYLLEYHRSVAQTDKEQETYVNLRTTLDDAAFRILSRHKINDWQDQVERLPEARFDWIKTPLFTHEHLGGVYFDAALRAGNLRRSPNDLGGSSYRAGRGDFDLGLEYKNALGPALFRGWGAARETIYSERPDSEESIDRFAGRAGWALALPFWKRYGTALGVIHHDVIPEVGTRHRFHVTRDPSELLFFDDEVESLYETDHVFLRMRTRLMTHVNRRRRKLVDFAVEARYFLRDRGIDEGHTWSSLAMDLRLNLLPWMGVRVRAEQGIEEGELLELNANLTVTPWTGFQANFGYQDLQGIETSRPLTAGATWRLNEFWGVRGSVQYDLETLQWLSHEGTVVRFFHQIALEVSIRSNPLQDDIAVTFNVVPLFLGADTLGQDLNRVAFYDNQ